MTSSVRSCVCVCGLLSVGVSNSTVTGSFYSLVIVLRGIVFLSSSRSHYTPIHFFIFLDLLLLQFFFSYFMFYSNAYCLLFLLNILNYSSNFHSFYYHYSSYFHSPFYFVHCSHFRFSPNVPHSSPYPQASNDRRLLLQMTTLLEEMNSAAEDTALLRAIPRSQDF